MEDQRWLLRQKVVPSKEMDKDSDWVVKEMEDKSILRSVVGGG